MQKSSFAQVQFPICVFLSYVSEDRDEVKKIGDYIRSAEFNIYLDIFYYKLQQDVESGYPAAITLGIEKGLSVSTHVMCIASEDTVNSWWVPYEIGYEKNASKQLSTLTLKNTVTIPPFLEIIKLIRRTRSLND